MELWTSAATHALLPLLATDAGRRLQLATGTAAHLRRFGRWEGGFWLPECAYEPGLERDLADHGVRAFCVDQTATAGFDHLRPVATAAGPVAVPIDWATVELVWNDRDGYPAHDGYRDYHRRTVHDLKPWDNAGRPYDHARARELARDARARLRRARGRAPRHGRAALLRTGHRAARPLVVRGAAAGSRAVLEEAPRAGLELVTLSEGIERVGAERRDLEASSWGARKDFSTWDSPQVAELAFAARRAELRTVAAGRRPGLARAARELLALQSSDWAFMRSRALAGDYPDRRAAAHAADLDAALGGLEDSAPALRNLAPDLDLASLTTP